jgi:hypothetical protein
LRVNRSITLTPSADRLDEVDGELPSSVLPNHLSEQRFSRCTRVAGCVTQAPFAVFAVIAANYQPSISRPPRKSWADNGTATRRTAAASAVLSLLSAVLEEKKFKNRKRGAAPGTGLCAK